LRSGLEVVAAQDVADCQLVDDMPQVRQGPLDPSIAPCRILCRYVDHELLDLLDDPWSAKRSSLLTPIKLLGD
jgi:hypothetical protein